MMTRRISARRTTFSLVVKAGMYRYGISASDRSALERDIGKVNLSRVNCEQFSPQHKYRSKIPRRGATNPMI